VLCAPDNNNNNNYEQQSSQFTHMQARSKMIFVFSFFTLIRSQGVVYNLSLATITVEGRYDISEFVLQLNDGVFGDEIDAFGLGSDVSTLQITFPTAIQVTQVQLVGVIAENYNDACYQFQVYYGVALTPVGLPTRCDSDTTWSVVDFSTTPVTTNFLAIQLCDCKDCEPYSAARKCAGFAPSYETLVAGLQELSVYYNPTALPTPSPTPSTTAPTTQTAAPATNTPSPTTQTTTATSVITPPPAQTPAPALTPATDPSATPATQTPQTRAPVTPAPSNTPTKTPTTLTSTLMHQDTEPQAPGPSFTPVTVCVWRLCVCAIDAFLQLYAAVGGGVGGCCVLICLVVLCVCLVRRRNRDDEDEASERMDVGNGSSGECAALCCV
jgi:hypothetical protein